MRRLMLLVGAVAWVTASAVLVAGSSGVASPGPGQARAAVGVAGAAEPIVSMTGAAASVLNPWGIAAGPDGALWFTNGKSIGRITTGGKVSVFKHAEIGAWGIVAGPDGALWFTNPWGNSIGRITTGGKVSVFRNAGISRREGADPDAPPTAVLWHPSGAERPVVPGSRVSGGADVSCLLWAHRGGWRCACAG
jgi:streptogramin lyase